MVKNTLIAIFALAALTGLLFLDLHRARVEDADEATLAPHSFAAEFSLPDLHGRTVTLSDYHGKIVLLDFWATWCDPCREEIPQFVELQNRYQNQGFQIIGISMDDSAEPVSQFYQTRHMNYPVAMGNAETGEQYGGILGLPVAFLIDRTGRIRARYTGAINLTKLNEDLKSLLLLPAASPSQ